MIALGIILLLSILLSGLGRQILFWIESGTGVLFFHQQNERGEHAIYAFGIGLLLFVYLVFLLGMLGYLQASVLWGVLLVLGMISFRQSLQLLGQLREFFRQWSFASFSLFEKMLLACLCVFAILNLFIALAPPTYGYGIHSLLPIAQNYVRTHHISFIPHAFAFRPQNMVMLYVSALLLHGDGLAQLFNYVLTLSFVGLLYVVAKQYVTRKYALLAVLIFYTMPLIGIVSRSITSEPGIMLYGFLAFSAFMRWWKSSELRWLAFSGIFSGFCGGFKIVGLEVLLVLGILLLLKTGWNLLASSSRIASLVTLGYSLGIFLGLAVIAGGNWYYLSYQRTGTPFYEKGNEEQLFSKYVNTLPTQSTVAHVPNLSLVSEQGNAQNAPVLELQRAPEITKIADTQAKNVSRWVNIYQKLSQRIFRRSRVGFLQAAWQLTMLQDHQKHIISPLFLVFFPLAFIFPSKEKDFYVYMLFCLLFFVFGIHLWGRYNRYMLPIFPVLSLVTVQVFQNIERTGKWIGYVSTGICMLMLLLYFPATLHAGLNHFPAAVGLESRESYVREQCPGTYEVAQYVNQRLPEEAKLLFISEFRFILFDREWIIGPGEYDGLLFKYAHIENPDKGYQRLQALGITHILINRQKSNNSEYNGDVEYLDRFCDTYLQEIYQNSDVFLYKLRKI